jgi:hypothetical protein
MEEIGGINKSTTKELSLRLRQELKPFENTFSIAHKLKQMGFK